MRRASASFRGLAEGAGAGADQGSPPVLQAPGAVPGGVDPEELRDWAGLPEELVVKVAGKLVAQNEATYAAWLKKDGETEGFIQVWMKMRMNEGNCLFVFAMVCKKWRKAQLKVGGPLRTRVESDVILPGRVALAKWALAEGCPREGRSAWWGDLSMAEVAAEYGHMELVRWLIQEQGFAMDRIMMAGAARSGNL